MGRAHTTDMDKVGRMQAHESNRQAQQLHRQAVGRNLEDMNSIYNTSRVKHPLFSAFRTDDAVNYFDIATVHVDRCVLDFATEPTDSFLGLITMKDQDEMYSSARVYEIDRRKPTDDDSDPDDAESEEDDDYSILEQDLDGDGTTCMAIIDVNEMMVSTASLDDCQVIERWNVIWAKFTGHAVWPVIVPDEYEGGARKGLNKTSGENSVLVQFFGTYDFARVTKKQVISFLKGLLSPCHLKCKKPVFTRALEEAEIYLSEQKLPKEMLQLRDGGSASLVGGFFVMVNNLWELRDECIKQYFNNNGSPDIEQIDCYKPLLGRKENFILHAINSTLTYILFRFSGPRYSWFLIPKK
ncbi:histone-lysine N-methyltransferase ATX2-like [Dorcoceras hygrometricum]|uniref:Histone-lysine N-methyltransferase ATX2-like n=1 Tax=Dorcoceras hygrometricum TaxID=472368 RepID=A0A2Z7CCL4_9LAMI|nr:histone-lysine N-methyltransferase ATX2-like [Dorcoceras hygrometricum]